MYSEQKHLFLRTLYSLVNEYEAEVDYPYEDSYFEIIKNGKVIGGMNPDGYNLLYNLTRLCEILKDELI